MAALQSTGWRVLILPLLIWAAVLLPTLHLHLQHGHDHGGPSHQHALVHADFWAGAAHAHAHTAQHDEDMPHDNSAASFAQSELAARAARSFGATLPKLEKSPLFLLVLPAIAQAPRAPAISSIKQEHPPPGEEALSVPTAPRSPPSLV